MSVSCFASSGLGLSVGKNSQGVALDCPISPRWGLLHGAGPTGGGGAGRIYDAP
jgi:hypothetical protein